MSKGKRWVVAGFVLCLSVAGCVTLGGSGDPVVRKEVPLVPLPPFPNGRAEAKAPPPVESPPSKAPTKSDEPTAPTSPAPPSPPSEDAKDDKPAPAPLVAPAARKLIETAQTRVADLDSYIVRLTRREQVGDRDDPDQLILFKFRKKPWSVHLKWLGKQGNGREVVYVKGEHQDKIHSRLAAGDVPFMPAGKRLSLALDNPLVKSATRHPVTEAGILASIDRLAMVQSALDKGDRKQGTLKLRTGVDRAEFSKRTSAIEHAIPAGIDPGLPKGGTRTYFFHPDNGLPMLIRTVDESDKEVEYYRYDRLQAEVKLDDADFDPKLLYGDK